MFGPFSTICMQMQFRNCKLEQDVLYVDLYYYWFTGTREKIIVMAVLEIWHRNWSIPAP